MIVGRSNALSFFNKRVISWLSVLGLGSFVNTFRPRYCAGTQQENHCSVTADTGRAEPTQPERAGQWKHRYPVLSFDSSLCTIPKCISLYSKWTCLTFAFLWDPLMLPFCTLLSRNPFNDSLESLYSNAECTLFTAHFKEYINLSTEII